MTEKDLNADANALGEVLKVLDRLPFVSSVKRDIQSLRNLIYERRAPRIVALGLPRAGSTSLVNALLGKSALADDLEPGRWIRIDAEGSLVDWLEVPLGSEDPEATRDRTRRALEESPADVALLVCAPEDLSSTLAGAAPEITDIVGLLADPKTLLAVLTQADTMPPATSPPPYPEDKGHAIALTRERLESALREAGLEARAVVAASARDGFGLGELSELIVDIVSDRARVEAARALVHASRGRREVANRIVQSASTLALTVGMAPVPFSDAFVIAPLQVTMVSMIAHLAGRPWDRATFAEWVASMGVVGGAGMGLRWTARQLLKLVPGAGTLVSAGVAGAGTVSIGQSAIAYFLRREPRLLAAG